MRTITLNYFELTRLIQAYFYVAAAIATLIVFARLTLMGHEISLVTIFQSATASLAIATLLFGLLASRPWTSKTLARWLGRPSIHGIWWGTLDTDWRDEDGETPPPIPIAFVIRQTYLFASIQSFTERQPAKSKFEFLGVDEKTTDTHLAYVYELHRTAYGENKLTTGYGYLTLQDHEKVLAGDYWTNSPTRGTLRLKFITQECDGVNSYESVTRIVEKTQREPAAGIN